MNQNLAMDDREAPEGTILFSSSSLLSDTKGGGKISGHKWGKLGGRPGLTGKHSVLQKTLHTPISPNLCIAPAASISWHLIFFLDHPKCGIVDT
jgi:hypothetical protein